MPGRGPPRTPRPRAPGAPAQDGFGRRCGHPGFEKERRHVEGRAPRSSGDRRHAGPPGRPGSPRPSRRRHRSGLAVGARERVDPADSHDPLSRGARAPWCAAALGRQLPGPSQASPRCPGRPRRRRHQRRHTRRQQEPEGSALPSGREAGNRRCCRGLRSRRQRRRPHAPRVLTLTAHRHASGAAPEATAPG